MKKTNALSLTTGLKGFSLPLSPTGTSALVDTPPWHFGGELMEVVYRTNAEVLAELLPPPFELIPDEAFVSIAMVDMISTSRAETVYEHPEKTNYRECLVKLHCLLNGKKVWYVPATWVTTDFSLLRGSLLGFGKKLGGIEMTKLHPLNPAVGGKRSGARLTGICEAFNAIHIEINITLTNKRMASDSLPFTGLAMCITRYIPDTAHPDHLLYHDVSALKVDGYQRDDLWEAEGVVRIRSSAAEPVTQLQPIEVICARTFSEGFTLHGTETLYTYGDNDGI